MAVVRIVVHTATVDMAAEGTGCLNRADNPSPYMSHLYSAVHNSRLGDSSVALADTLAAGDNRGGFPAGGHIHRAACLDNLPMDSGSSFLDSDFHFGHFHVEWRLEYGKHQGSYNLTSLHHYLNHAEVDLAYR